LAIDFGVFVRDLEPLPMHLFFDAEDEVLQGTGNHVVGVEELVYRVHKFIVVFEQICDFIGGVPAQPVGEERLRQ
jgi:hypothetical protein